MIKLKILSENAWSDVNVQLKKRHDLIPNIINTVKGFAKHEQETLEKVISARNAAVDAQSTERAIKAEATLSSLLPKIFALSESYPDLKANVNFLDLQNNLTSIEKELSQARRYYNAVVRDFNTKQQVFPSSLIASMFNFRLKEFFEVSDNEKNVPEVKF